MKVKIALTTVIFALFLISHSQALAQTKCVAKGSPCDYTDPPTGQSCQGSCQEDPPNSGNLVCKYDNAFGPRCRVPQPFEQVFGPIKAPDPVAHIGYGVTGVKQFIKTGVDLLYTAAVLYFFFSIIYSGFQWLSSGGNKEKIESSQKRINAAIIGLVLMALAFVFIRIIGEFVGFDLLNISF